MATGDAAAAKGLRVVPASQDIKQGYDAINQRGDELAEEMDARASADALKLDAALVKVQATALTVADAVGTLRFW